MYIISQFINFNTVWTLKTGITSDPSVYILLRISTVFIFNSALLPSNFLFVYGRDERRLFFFGTSNSNNIIYFNCYHTLLQQSCNSVLWCMPDREKVWLTGIKIGLVRMQLFNDTPIYLTRVREILGFANSRRIKTPYGISGSFSAIV